jgi:hypothetical protein
VTDVSAFRDQYVIVTLVIGIAEKDICPFEEIDGWSETPERYKA